MPDNITQDFSLNLLLPIFQIHKYPRLSLTLSLHTPVWLICCIFSNCGISSGKTTICLHYPSRISVWIFFCHYFRYTSTRDTLAPSLSLSLYIHPCIYFVLYFPPVEFPPERQQDFASIGVLLSILHNVCGCEFWIKSITCHLRAGCLDHHKHVQLAVYHCVEACFFLCVWSPLYVASSFRTWIVYTYTHEIRHPLKPWIDLW